jgi:phospholipase/lecithinase/hemolysin
MTRLLVFLAALLLLSPVHAQVSKPASIVVFGDSLSDTGNAFEATGHAVPPSPPYFDGRFSNGPVWVEVVAEHFGLKVEPALQGGTNFAVGGAKLGTDLDNMMNQVQVFLNTSHVINGIHPDDLFIVFGGGNDLSSGLGVSDQEGFVTETAMKVGDIIDELAAHGAAIFLVPNIPNRGLAPAARSRGTEAEEQALTLAFNAAVDVIVADAATRLNVKIIRVDLFTLAQSAVTMPAPFGFTDVTNPCLVKQGAAFAVCSAPDFHLFWDDIHPTERGHQLIASTALAAFQSASAQTNQPVSPHPSVVERIGNEVRKFIKRL